jgi:histone H3/H4
MSDYSFLRTGFSNLAEPTRISDQERENIEIMLGLFTSNALINASKYATMCKRNAVTKTDMLYGLQYEVFEFLQRPNIDQGLQEIKEEYEQMCKEEFGSDEEYDSEEYEEEGEEGEGLDLLNTGLDKLVVNDEETPDFSRIDDSLIDEENREFIEKMHQYNDTWDDWSPQNDLERILKSAIDKVN